MDISKRIIKILNFFSFQYNIYFKPEEKLHYHFQTMSITIAEIRIKVATTVSNHKPMRAKLASNLMLRMKANITRHETTFFTLGEKICQRAYFFSKKKIII